jgi:putative transcriptional regulator
MKKKRDLFAELTEGFDALAAQRTGRRRLRMHLVRLKRARKINARQPVSGA